MKYHLLIGCCLLLGLCGCQPAEFTFPERAVPDSVATNAAFFEKQVLMQHLTDPLEISIAADGRVFVVERGGAIHRWDPETKSSKRIGYIPVYAIIEDGLLALALDPDFVKNGWLYVFYGPANGGDSRLSRFTVADDRIDPASERILLEVPMQREACCHAAGSLAFGPDGTLFLAVGDNTDHIDTAGGPIDERPGHQIADAQHTAANTNDLRGKILRIRPEPDGTYSIPEGNLFEADNLHRPEIYTMGHRNPFRISIDPATGWLYFGDVGNGDPPNERGDWGWDEFNQARGPGNYGWPYLTGNNQPYRDFDYATGTVGEPFDPVRLINDSPNNTGARALPPAQPAMIWYTFGQSEAFPELGAGGVNPMAGPVYRRAVTHGTAALPDYYIGKHFIYDWMRNWVMLVSFDEASGFAAIEPFLPEIKFARPMDMEVGPDGALYVIEWGRGFWGSNHDAQVVRIVYHGRTKQALEELTREYTPLYQVVIKTPAPGSFFRFDEPIQFEASVKDASGKDLPPPTNLTIHTYTGFDTNTFLLDEQSGTNGQIIVTRDFTHVPDLHYIDRFAEIEACYTDDKGHEHCARHKLQPHHKEAEHFSQATAASRQTYGIQPASAAFAETALTVMQLKNEGQLLYQPIHLSSIEAIRLRYKLLAPAILTLHNETEEIARLDLTRPRGKALPALPQALTMDRLLVEGQGHLIERLKRSVYEGWYELMIPLPATESPTSLKLQAQGDSDDVLLEIDALTFVNQ